MPKGYQIGYNLGYVKLRSSSKNFMKNKLSELIFFIFGGKDERGKLSYKANGFTIRQVDNSEKDILDKIHKLRSDVFHNELKWVEEPESGKEYDHYDSHVIHFGVFDQNNNVIGCSRLLVYFPAKGFMIHREFINLLEEPDIKNIDLPNAVEISRLAIDEKYREIKIGNLRSSQHLYNIMYKWSRLNKKRYWVFVSGEIYINKLRNKLGVDIKILGKGKEYEKGLLTLVGMIDLSKVKWAPFNFIIKNTFADVNISVKI